MKRIGLLLFLVCLSTGSAEGELARVDYDLAELVFRQYMSGDAKIAFHITCSTNAATNPADFVAASTNSTPLPADFLARFAGKRPFVRGDLDRIAVAGNKSVLDTNARLSAVVLNIREIRREGDHAEVEVISYLSSTSNGQRFYLAREFGRWKVQKRECQWVADF